MSQKIFKNAIIGQSGGPSAAINATLSGIIRGLNADSRVEKIYGMLNGISGVIDDRIIEIGSRFKGEDDYRLLECTPSSGLGTCRVKLPDVSDETFYEKIFAVLDKYEIGYFLLIGGNDSMDTVDKLSAYAKAHEKATVVVGVSKTIDNDLILADHTPGYGSAAKYIGTVCSEIAGDCAVYTTKAVTIVEIMGRDAGWLTLASGLGRLSGMPCPDLIYLPEVVFDYDSFLESVKKELEKKPNVVVAVSEGVKTADGKYAGEGCQTGAVDIFGHKYLAGVAKALEQYVKEKIGCKVRAVELNLPQRCAGHCLSATDIRESVELGKSAARAALDGKNCCFAIITRLPGAEYKTGTDTVPVHLVANKVKAVPREYITEDGSNVTDEALRYVAPLTEGEVEIPYKFGAPQRFTF